MDDVMDERLPDQEIWVKAIVARQNESRWRVTDGSSTFEVHVEKDVLDRLKRENLKITCGNIFRTSPIYCSAFTSDGLKCVSHSSPASTMA